MTAIQKPKSKTKGPSTPVSRAELRAGPSSAQDCREYGSLRRAVEEGASH